MSDSRLVQRIRRCTHDESISVIAEGLERVICEDCGVVIIRYESMIAGDISRSQFARRADALHEHTHRVEEASPRPNLKNKIGSSRSASFV